ncbi:hypothetical protein D3C81_1299430 [compost metagenome]
MTGQHAVAVCANYCASRVVPGTFLQLRTLCSFEDGNSFVQRWKIDFPDDLALCIGDTGIVDAGIVRFSGKGDHTGRKRSFVFRDDEAGSFLPLFRPILQGMAGFHRRSEDLHGRIHQHTEREYEDQLHGKSYPGTQPHTLSSNLWPLGLFLRIQSAQHDDAEDRYRHTD